MKRVLLTLEVEDKDYDRVVSGIQQELDEPLSDDFRVVEYETFEEDEKIPDYIKRD